MILALLLVGGVTVAGCAPSSVEDEVAALTERVDTLENQMQTLEAAGGNARLEQEAQQAYTQLNQLVASNKIDEAKAKLGEYGTKYAATKLGRSIQGMANELAVIGKDCPSSWGIEKWFQGEDAVRLDGDGTMVVVFWESWCPHCRREVPKLQQMYDKFKGQGLQMIGLTRVNRSATEEAVQDIITQNNVKYPIAKEDGSAATYFAVSGIPAAAVVKDRKVVWRGHPARITEAMVQDWLSS
jgi:thiol-disulfide isomerase/thioredoxin